MGWNLLSGYRWRNYVAVKQIELVIGPDEKKCCVLQRLSCGRLQPCHLTRGVEEGEKYSVFRPLSRGLWSFLDWFTSLEKFQIRLICTIFNFYCSMIPSLKGNRFFTASSKISLVSELRATRKFRVFPSNFDAHSFIFLWVVSMHFVINFVIQSFILNITRNEIEQIKYLDLASKHLSSCSTFLNISPRFPTTLNVSPFLCDIK